MKYCFKADNHAIAYIVAPVNSFSSASFTDITTCVARTSCSGCQDGPGACCCYFAGIIIVLYYIIAAPRIYTLLGAILFNKMERIK